MRIDALILTNFWSNSITSRSWSKFDNFWCSESDDQLNSCVNVDNLAAWLVNVVPRFKAQSMRPLVSSDSTGIRWSNIHSVLLRSKQIARSQSKWGNGRFTFNVRRCTWSPRLLSTSTPTLANAMPTMASRLVRTLVQIISNSVQFLLQILRKPTGSGGVHENLEKLRRRPL